MDACVVFTDSDNPGWRRVLEPGFRHCFVVVRMHPSLPWVVLDAMNGRPWASVVGVPEMDVETFYRDLGYTVIRAHRGNDAEWGLLPVLPTCVGMVKSVLGLTAPLVQTPKALYRRLARDAAARTAK